MIRGPSRDTRTDTLFPYTALFRSCLGALEASTYRDFEILICENGGDQAFSELVHALPSALPGGQPIRAVKAPGNVGYAGGVNIGMKETATAGAWWILNPDTRSEEHTSELQSLMRISYAVFCLKKKKTYITKKAKY